MSDENALILSLIIFSPWLILAVAAWLDPTKRQ